MDFIDEIHQIKKEKAEELFDQNMCAQKKAKEEFIARIQNVIDNFDAVKEGIKSAANQSKSQYVVVDHIFTIKLPIFGQTKARVFGCSLSNRKGRRILRDTNKKQYECASGSLLTSKPEPQGLNGRWYYVDETAGKSLVYDEKLIELWDQLEALGLKPFFSGGTDSVSLCARF